MEGLAVFPDKYFDLAVVDPPYGISGKHTFSGAGKLKNRTLNQNAKQVKAWDIAPTPDYFAQLFRVSKNQIIWGGNYFALPPSRCWVCWDKLQPFVNFSAFEMAWTSFDCPEAIYRERVTSSVPSCERIHPTQKSVALYKWLYQNYAKTGDKILDTHAGSASSFVAAYDMGFDYVGFEIDPEYHAAAAKRVDAVMAQLRISDIWVGHPTE
jgi:site-specific DNA-methyltransferase (adenine-specific)